nr:hypothetical protein [Cryptosporangium arvum]
MWTGFSADTSGRTRDHAPSAPTRTSVVALDPSANVSSCRPSPRDRAAVSLWPPADRACGQRVDQDPAQVAAEDLRARPGTRVVEQHVPVGVEHPLGLGALVDVGPEPV